ncbi:hypothetical protein EX30DRAFT_85741 [Ascodesmis nigricans]|uniref:Uncharacterized protein n=1 Tax=Ascodesmis nigricans TaxID=341454 RepID=A0A4S2N390_9PEZI|nr:hypothetical protein EX30DRAFT_85741 [Ascodesmis nigricans]
MSKFSVPSTGITLGPVPSETLQALRLDFVDGALLEAALKQGADLKITFGKSMKLQCGKNSIEVIPTIDTTCHELYMSDSSGSSKLDFVGTFSHILEVRGSDVGGVNEAKAKLQKSYEMYNDQKAASSTMVMDSSQLPPAVSGRRAMYAQKKGQRSTGQSKPTTPSLKSTRSPLPDVEQGPTVPQATLDALRIPLLHLLALGPASEHSLSIKTRAPEDAITKVLNRIARRGTAGRKWELIDDFYKELDPWEFPYVKDKHRERAISNARDAFGRLRLSKDAPEYRVLLSPEEREKAEVAATTPKPPSVRKPASEGQASPPTVAKPSPALKSEDPKPAPTTKKAATAKNNISRIISGKKKAPAKLKGAIGRPPKAASATKKAPAKPKAAPKYKSKEFVDSDIEFDDEVSRQPSPPPAPAQPAKKSVSPPQPISMKRTVSKSSSVTASDTENVRTGAKRPAPTSDVSPAKRPKTSGTTPLGTSSQTSQKSVAAERKPATKSLVRKDDVPDADTGRKSEKRPAPPTSAPSPAKRPRMSDVSSSAGSSSQSGVHKLSKPTTTTSRYDAPPSVRSISNSPPKPSPLGSSPPITATNGAPSTASSPDLTPDESSTASQSPLGVIRNRSRLTNGAGVKRKANGVATNGKTQKKFDSHVLQLARNFREEYERYKRAHDELARGPRSRITSDKIRKLEMWDKELRAMKQRIEKAADSTYR